MRRITSKEEEIMRFFWEKGPLFVKEIVAFYPDPKPHYNTVSTMVRALAEKGYLGWTAYGNTYRYHAVVSLEDYDRGSLRGLVKKHFGNSFRRVVSTLIEEEDLSVEELKELISEIEKKQKTQK